MNLLHPRDENPGRTRRAPTRTKIVATLGPASRELSQIRGLIRAGADVFRVNFSHGTRQQHRETIRAIREASQLEHAPIAVLADLQGPKIRVGALKDDTPIQLETNDQLVIVPDENFLGVPGRVGCTYTALAEEVQPGEPILVDDGNLELRVTKVRDGEVHTRVVFGGLLRAHKGINLPGTAVRSSSLTDKDLLDLDVIMDEGVDYLALSFVRTEEDIHELRARIEDRENPPEIIAKMERPEAVRNMVEIVDAADGIMVARGDMGVELGPEEVPPIQKQLIALAVHAAKPVITATQMLESMIENPRPTRAEASDVANAIYDGTSAVMLSGETAMGRHPMLTVRTMNRIARRTESAVYHGEETGGWMVDHTPTPSIAEATVRAAAHAARSCDARGILVFTESGRTAKLLARERLPMHLFAFTPHARTWRRLGLQWGIIPMMLSGVSSIDELRRRAVESLVARKFVESGDRLVSIAGTINLSGATNTVHIEDVP